MLSKVDEGLSHGPFPAGVAILQMALLASLNAAGELSAFVASWQSARERGWNAVWALPGEASARGEVVEFLKKAGFGAHGSADDGACLVEVHKPDGTITIGMPGPAL